MPLPLTGASKRERVWDPFVRLFHWSLVAAFVTAWFGRGEAIIHETAGQFVLALVIFRTAWGIIGPGSARFETFVRGPITTLHYVLSIIRGKPKHYLGHNPAGAAMIMLLMATLAVTTASGLLMTTTALWGNAAVEYVHGTSAYLMLFLIGGHLFGVLMAAIQHRENLPLAMVTGRKWVPSFAAPYLGKMRLGRRRLLLAGAVVAASTAVWAGSTGALNASIWRLHKTVASEAKTSGCEVTKVDGPVVMVFPKAGVSYAVHARLETAPMPVFVDIGAALQRKPVLDLSGLKSKCGVIAARLERLKTTSTSAIAMAMKSQPAILAVAPAAVRPTPPAASQAVPALPVAAPKSPVRQAEAPIAWQSAKPPVSQITTAARDAAPAASASAPPARSRPAVVQVKSLPVTVARPSAAKPRANVRKAFRIKKRDKRKRKGRRSRNRDADDYGGSGSDDNSGSGSGNSGSGSGGNSGSGGGGNSGSGSGNSGSGGGD